MDKETYRNERENLMIEARRCIENDDLYNAEEIMSQVDTLDDEFYDELNQIENTFESEETERIAEANQRALMGTKIINDVVNPGVDIEPDFMTNVLKNAVAIDTTKKNEKEVSKMDFENMNRSDVLKSDVYTNAWAKSLMGQPLTEDENTAYRMVNEDFEHTTKNTGSVIPDNIAQGIWSEVEDLYPYFADITKTNVKGNLTIVKATESTDAAWYDEATETETGTETFETVQLSGCELSRAIAVSWKLKEMAIADFIPYIQRRMAEAMGAALGYGVVQGKGADADKPEPMGIITAIEADKSQVVEGDASYKTITTARGKIKSGYATGIAVYANGETIWGSLANITDDNGRPLFIHDAAAEDGVFRILGMPVKEDASVPTGDVLMSNASRGYQGNVNEEITVVTEDHARQRITDYVGYGIFDGAPLTMKAHALIKLGE